MTDELTLPPCTEEDPELFFPLGFSKAAQAQAEEAKSVCRRCPGERRAQCLDDALNSHHEGVWGATTLQERRWMRPREPESANRFREQDELIRAIPLDISNQAAAAMLGVDRAVVRRVRLQPVDLGR